MAYNPRTDVIKDRAEAERLRRQASEALNRHKDVNTYKSLTRAAQSLEAEAKRIEQQQSKKQA